MKKLRIVDRPFAHDMELPRFYTGKRCRFGHLAERYTTSGNCVECDARRATRNQQKYRHKLKVAARGK